MTVETINTAALTSASNYYEDFVAMSGAMPAARQ